jgi:cell division septation protein DedD
MKRAALELTLLLFAFSASAENFTVRVQETATIEIPGVTAAYAIDPAIADVSAASGGRVIVTGRSAGTTQLIGVTANGTRSFLVTVAARVATNVPRAVASHQPIARVESRYASDSGQMQNGFDAFTNDGERQSQFHLISIHRFRNSFGQSTDALPSVFYRITSPRRSITFLDEIVDTSAVTIHSMQVRGFHYLDRSLEIHAGYAATSMYDDLFLPSGRRWLASAAYGIGFGNVRLIPSAYVFLSEPSSSAARKGVIGALAIEKKIGETLFARGEIAMSWSPAGSAEVRYNDDANVLRARASYKPADFPTLALSDVPGTHAEGDWSHRATRNLQLDSYGSYDQLTTTSLRQTIGIANVAARYQLSRSFSALTGLNTTFVKEPATSFRTIGIPVGLTFDTPRFGAASSYRLLDTSNSSRRGDAFRFSVRAGTALFRVNAWAERQRQAPTLDLIFREEPGLELALLRLGISVRSPEDLARVLQDNAALINLGYIEGVTVNLTPLRRQAGIDVALDSPDLRNQLRLHAVTDRAEGVGAVRSSTIATLTYSRRLLEATDIFGSYSKWRTGLLSRQTNGSAYQIGIRQRIDGMPDFLKRRGTIQGIVYLDPNMRGARIEGTTPVAGEAVTLDGARSAWTDEHGHYAFRDVPPGIHHVAAELSASKPAFFTTPSRVEVEPSATADFGLVWSSARINGHIISDATLGIAGVVISAKAPDGKSLNATTDSDGAFALAVPAGKYTIALAPESLPSGYISNGATMHEVDLKPDSPQQLAFEVRALRSISGSAIGATEVRIESLGRTAQVDASGNFVFRSLPTGTFTITAGNATRTITLPPEPATLSVTLNSAAVTPGAHATSSLSAANDNVRAARNASLAEGSPVNNARVAARAIPENRDRRFRVQAGAYRVAENAAIARHQIERLGYRANVTTSGNLQLVFAGPFASQSEAASAVERMSRSGLEGIIVAGPVH